MYSISSCENMLEILDQLLLYQLIVKLLTRTGQYVVMVDYNNRIETCSHQYCNSIGTKESSMLAGIGYLG